MTTLKKLALLVLSLVTSASVLAACGAPEENSSPTETPIQSSSPTESETPETPENPDAPGNPGGDEIVDTAAPVLSVIDESVFAGLKDGDAITVPTVTATDETDGDVTVSVVFGTETEQASVQMGAEITLEEAGTYILKYTASDAAGNVAEKTVIIAVACVHEYSLEGADDTHHWTYCGKCGEREAESVAEHVFKDEKDEEKHWQECDCGKIAQKADHSYGGLSYGEAGNAYYCDCGAYLTNEDLVDFVVEIEENKDPVVLQLSDTQIWSWGATPEEQCYRYVREVVEKTNPDLIILTGDVVYGKFDPKGQLLTGFIAFMETLNTPWAPVFGNHDNESLMGVDWQCDQFEAAKNCLFKQGDLTGNGNYSVGLEQGGELLRVFYMMDSNGCGEPMIDSNGNHTSPAPGTNVVKTWAGFGQDQIDWYTEEINAIHAVDADVKISMAYHIQQAIFLKSFQKYDEYDGSTTNSALKNPLNLDTMETADETDFGYVGRPMKGGWDNNYKIFNGMKALGVDSIFVGHEHCNSSSIVYEGVRFQYAQKSSTYDRYNSVMEDGTIIGDGSTPEGAHALVGGTVIPVSQVDGSIGTGYICYYGNPFYFEPKPEPIIVNGMQFGTQLTSHVANTVKAVKLEDGSTAYEYKAPDSWNKLYICQDGAVNANALKGKTTVSFDILFNEATEGEAFAIRIKPNPTAEQVPGISSGYLYFNESYEGDRKVTTGEWKTVTMDISSYADVCTEFAIYLFAGTTAYVRNVMVS